MLAEAELATWLGEAPAGMEAVKACLKTVEGVRWTMSKEERAAKAKRAKPTISDPQWDSSSSLSAELNLGTCNVPIIG